jgi:hypothetical protein
MEYCPHRMTCRPVRSPRRARRLLARVGALAIAFAFVLAVVTLIFIGERWLLVEAPTSGVDLGVAASAASAAGVY